MKRKLVKGDFYYRRITISNGKLAYLFDNSYILAIQYYSGEVMDYVKYVRIILDIIG